MASGTGRNASLRGSVAGSRMVSEYSKEVHAVKKVRFEIKLSTYRDGRTLARIYDDYWDSMDIDLFDPAHPEQVDLKAFKELAAQLANRKPGWYAIEVEDYPFGKAARLSAFPAGICDMSEPTGTAFESTSTGWI